MSKQKRVKVVSKDNDGNEVELFVMRPTAEQLANARMAANKAFKQARDSEAMPRRALEEYLEKEGIWSKEKQKKVDKLGDKILEKEKLLAKGGIRKGDAKRLALEIRGHRLQQMRLLGSRREMDNYTIEAQAENAHFDYLVSVCTVGKDGQPLFKSVTDYLNNNTEPYAVEAASELANIMYDLDPQFEHKLQENKVLKQLGFVDEELRLVNAEGHLIDVKGRLIDEEGRYVNENEEFININGDRVDEDGNIIDPDAQPFLEDDEGEPLPDNVFGSEDEEEEEEEPTETTAKAPLSLEGEEAVPPEFRR